MNSAYQLPEWAAFVAAIRANPTCDLPRQVAADWLDERGECERAELIRVQVELARLRETPWFQAWQAGELHNKDPALEHGVKIADLHRREVRLSQGVFGDRLAGVVLHGGSWECDRGFLSSVRAPLAVLLGGECRRCGGTGRHDPTGARVRSIRCPTCHGTGLTPGFLTDHVQPLVANLLAVEPLTGEGIVVTDCDPLDNAGVGTYFGEAAGPADQWHWLSQTGSTQPPWELPADVYDALESDTFDSEAAARLALGRALFSIHAPKPAEVTT